jgi:hypothetical protein
MPIETAHEDMIVRASLSHSWQPPVHHAPILISRLSTEPAHERNPRSNGREWDLHDDDRLRRKNGSYTVCSDPVFVFFAFR